MAVSGVARPFKTHHPAHVQKNILASKVFNGQQDARRKSRGDHSDSKPHRDRRNEGPPVQSGRYDIQRGNDRRVIARHTGKNRRGTPGQISRLQGGSSYRSKRRRSRGILKHYSFITVRWKTVAKRGRFFFVQEYSARGCAADNRRCMTSTPSKSK